MPKMPLCQEEKMLSYSKYYYWELLPPHPLAMDLIKDPMALDDILPLENANDLTLPGYLKREHGWCILPDGTGYSACYHYMPNVTVEMIDWWFAWHFIAPPSVPKDAGNLRYKIWCPVEHWDTGFVDEATRTRCIDPNVPMREKRYNSTNFIDESLDGGVGPRLYFQATSLPPWEMGIDKERLLWPESGSFITAVTNPGCPMISIYQFRPCYGGVEMRIRNWRGMYRKDGKFYKAIDRSVTPEEMRGGLMHCMIEYPHLGRFLPYLYAEEGKKPLDAY